MPVSFKSFVAPRLLLNDCWKYFYKERSRLSSTSTQDESERRKALETEKIIENPKLDQPPTTCCMSGCSNCVYIVWADALIKKMATKDPVIAEKILSNVDDTNMKEYLKLELRLLGVLK